MKAKVRVTSLLKGGHEPRNVGSLRKYEKERKQSPRATRTEHNPSNILVLAQRDLW